MEIKEYSKGNNGPVIIWLCYEFKKGDIDASIEVFFGDIDEEYTIIAVIVDDWFSDLSPWKSSLLDNKFEGKASYTFDYIQKEIISIYKEKRDIYIMGYSLAGLFAIWSLCNCDSLSGAVSCSGSLWYPEFLDYLVKESEKLSGKKVYLSVGGKEANSSDPMMANVITATMKSAELLKENNRIKFNLDKGGHFANTAKRLVKGIAYILSK